MLYKFFTLCSALLLTACASAPESGLVDQGAVSANAWAIQPLYPRAGAAGGAGAAPVWQHYLLPGKQATVFSYTRVDGRDTMTAQAQASASMLRQSVNLAAANLG